MERNYDVARMACVKYYMERGNSEEQAVLLLPQEKHKIFDLYDNIQEEREQVKRLKVEKVYIGNLVLDHIMPIDESPTVSD